MIAADCPLIVDSDLYSPSADFGYYSAAGFYPDPCYLAVCRFCIVCLVAVSVNVLLPLSAVWPFHYPDPNAAHLCKHQSRSDNPAASYGILPNLFGPEPLFLSF
ncbi:hypothetical protein D3C80_1245790 [compost metagenome]